MQLRYLARILGAAALLSVSAVYAPPAIADPISQLHVVQGQASTTYRPSSPDTFSISHCTSADANVLNFSGSHSNVQLSSSQSNLLPGIADWGPGTVSLQGSASAGALSDKAQFGPGEIVAAIPQAALTAATAQMTIESAAGRAEVSLHLAPSGQGPTGENAMRCAEWTQAATVNGHAGPSTGWWADVRADVTFEASIFPNSPQYGQPLRETGTGYIWVAHSKNQRDDGSGGWESWAGFVTLVTPGSASSPLDAVPPTVGVTTDRPANAAGWYNAPVTLQWQASDPSPSAGQPNPATLTTSANTEGQGVTYASPQFCDVAGNCATGSTEVNLDLTAPDLASVSLATSPLPIGGSATVTAGATDSLSGVVGGEWFLDTDPGLGVGTSMTFDGTTLTGQVPAGTTPGVHTVGVRARDKADNWSDVSTVYLVVYDPTGGFATGGGWIIPGGTTSDAGDQLPGLDGSSKANLGFVVKYDNGQSSVPGGNMQFHYQAGKFRLKSTGMDWLVVTNQNWAKFQGLGTVDGMNGVVPFRVEARDGDKSGQPDRFVIRIWAPGAKPDVTEPLYVATGDVQGGKIQIHKQ